MIGLVGIDHLTLGRQDAGRRPFFQQIALQDLQQVLHLPGGAGHLQRSEEHTSELQSLMRISYAVFCLKKKQQDKNQVRNIHTKVCVVSDLLSSTIVVRCTNSDTNKTSTI